MSCNLAADAKDERETIEGVSMDVLAPLIIRYAMNSLDLDVYSGLRSAREIMTKEWKNHPGHPGLLQGWADMRGRWRVQHDLDVAAMRLRNGGI